MKDADDAESSIPLACIVIPEGDSTTSLHVMSRTVSSYPEAACDSTGLWLVVAVRVSGPVVLDEEGVIMEESVMWSLAYSASIERFTSLKEMP